MSGVNGIVDLGRNVQAALPLQALCMSREDWMHSFFQLDLDETSQHVYCATACDDALGIRIFKPLKILYGAANAPPQFCRVETAILTIVCELSAVPAVPHVDDNITVETVDAMATTGQAMVAVHEALGFKVSPAKAVPSRMRDDGEEIKLHGMSTGVRLGITLGVESDWNLSSYQKSLGHLVHVQMPAAKSFK